MGEPKATASIIIHLAEKFEDDSSDFYEELAKGFEENKATFLSFANESKKNKVLIIRTYRETITDALEACFSFEDLDLNKYAIKTNLSGDASFSDALNMAIALEDKTSKFYTDVAELSKNLLATIPAAFRKVAERRNRRKKVLESLLSKVAKP